LSELLEQYNLLLWLWKLQLTSRHL